VELRLLAGPPPATGPESFASHLARLGGRPTGRAAHDAIPTLESSGLLGRGGAGFPVGRKWRSVASQPGGPPVILVNGAEGEPLSAKDRTLLELRPHLVLDGALIAANALGADRVALYVGSEHRGARVALRAALAERPDIGLPVAIVNAPDAYVAGEESAAVRFVNEGDARPTMAPPRPYQRGIAGRPTLVQNVESLAAAALIARRGASWWREAGRGATPGTALVTVTGSASDGAREIELGTPIYELAELSGAGTAEDRQAVLLGGYFGGWVPAERAWRLPLDPIALRDAGTALGCGVVAFLGREVCGVQATARIVDWMAGQSAAQCGPCVFGLRAIADAAGRIAAGHPDGDDLVRIERWTEQLAGRGACRHPDGAAGQLESSLRVFGAEWTMHQRQRRCSHGDAGRPATNAIGRRVA
jgi:NADH:ubiquinone oxidoreductase subunit F (NADH-binding)